MQAVGNFRERFELLPRHISPANEVRRRQKAAQGHPVPCLPVKVGKISISSTEQSILDGVTFAYRKFGGIQAGRRRRVGPDERPRMDLVTNLGRAFLRIVYADIAQLPLPVIHYGKYSTKPSRPEQQWHITPGGPLLGYRVVFGEDRILTQFLQGSLKLGDFNPQGTLQPMLHHKIVNQPPDVPMKPGNLRILPGQAGTVYRYIPSLDPLREPSINNEERHFTASRLCMEAFITTRPLAPVVLQ